MDNLKNIVENNLEDLEWDFEDSQKLIEADLEEIKDLPSIEDRCTSLGQKILTHECLLEAFEGKYKKIKQAIEAEKKYHENKLYWLRVNLAAMVDRDESTQLVNDRVYIYNKFVESVEVEDPQELPERYQRIKVEADKRLIAESFKNGEAVQGAKLITERKIQVKLGGEKAKAAAAQRLKRLAKKDKSNQPKEVEDDFVF